MSNISLRTVAFATAVVGYDYLQDEEAAIKPYDRFVVAVGHTGSAAAGDCQFSLRVGGQERGKFSNTATGLAITKDHMLADRIFVSKNIRLQCVVTVAPGTNPVALRLVVIP